MIKPERHVEGDASGEESAGEMTWPQPVFDGNNFEAVPQRNIRLLKKKKRKHYNSFSHSGSDGSSINVVSDPSALSSAMHHLNLGNRTPYGKNSRKSRNGHRVTNRRHDGKDLWNRVSDEVEELQLDHDDPDYDSDANDPVSLEAYTPELNDEEFEDIFQSLLDEYYANCNVEEIISSLRELAITPLQRRRIPYIAINLALQHKLSVCELTSELLSEMCGKILNPTTMQQGFMYLLEELPDIVIDVPKAPEYVGRFIARAVADDVLPPKFVQNYKEINSSAKGNGVFAQGITDCPRLRIASRSNSDGSSSVCTAASSSGVSSTSEVFVTTGACQVPASEEEKLNYSMQAILKAETLLTLSHAYSRLDIIWGIPPNERVTTLLMKQIRDLLHTYLVKDNLIEATNSLQELDSPHFHHELVFQAIILVLERDLDDVGRRILRLLDHLCRSVVVTLNQLETGVRRVYSEMPEIRKELPLAYILLERFVERANQAGFFPRKLANEMPAKHRKRFISEGDAIHKSRNPYKL